MGIPNIDDVKYTEKQGGTDEVIEEKDMENEIRVMRMFGDSSNDILSLLRWINIRLRKEDREIMMILVYDVSAIREILKRMPKKRKIEIVMNVRVKMKKGVVEDIMKKKPKNVELNIEVMTNPVRQYKESQDLTIRMEYIELCARCTTQDIITTSVMYDELMEKYEKIKSMTKLTMATKATKKQKKPVIEEKTDTSITDEEIKEFLEVKEKVEKYKKKMFRKYDEDPEKKEAIQKELKRKYTAENSAKYKTTKMAYSGKKRMCEVCGKEYANSSYYVHLKTKKHLIKASQK